MLLSRRSLPFTTVLSAAIALLALAAPVAAQAPAKSSACNYQSCALTIVPAWNGLAVSRGDTEERVANLNFFAPRDITAVLRGDPSAPGANEAATHARQAVRVRRMAAAFTNVGVGALVIALARNRIDGADDGLQTILTIGGATAFSVSVPLQFAADGALSRAVWWHNVRYSR